MIRLPVTSITLSPNDIDYHLQQIDIYHGLLKQGFKKKDILRFFQKQEIDKAIRISKLERAVDLQVPDTVQLVTSRAASLAASDVSSLNTTAGVVGMSHEYLNGPNIIHDFESTLSTCQRSTKTAMISSSDEHQNLDPSNCQYHDTNDKLHDTSLPKEVQLHAPRKSSLLRYTKTISVPLATTRSHNEEDTDLDHNMSPDKCPGSDASLPVGSDSGDLRVLRAADCGQVITATSQSMSDSLNTVHVGSVREQDVGITSALTGTSVCDRAELPFRPRNSPSTPLPKDERAGPQTRCPTLTDGTEDIASSPPAILGTKPSSDLEEGSTLATATPVTPEYDRKKFCARAPQTNHSYLRTRVPERSRFTIYNDFLPADDQPQTPVDVTSSSFLNQRNVAYTAPPGMLRWDMPRGRLVDEEEGEEDRSPTMRAMAVTSRRHREYSRSLHVEGLMLSRDRRRTDTDHVLDVPSIRGNVRTNRHGLVDLWIDELDADRVGEENFQGEGEFGSNDLMDARMIGNNRPTRSR